jgi:curli biogenesis system outer membrane secretion channel CsgG
MNRMLGVVMCGVVMVSGVGCRHKAKTRAQSVVRQTAPADEFRPPPNYQGPTQYVAPVPAAPVQVAPARAQGPLLAPAIRPVGTGIRRRVAVVNFEDVAQYQGFEGDRRALAAAAADVVSEALHNSGAFIVVEREQLQHVLAEQNLGSSGLVTPKSAAKMGQLLGLQALITGKITDLNVIHSRSGFGGYYAKDSVKYHARVSLRMVDAITGETWSAESGEGEAIQSSAVVMGAGKATRDDTLGKKALYAAINAMMGKLVASAANRPWSGAVASVTKGKIYITGGSEVGVPPGTMLSVHRLGPEITDPTTGQVIGRETGQVLGSLQVVDHLNAKVTTCVPVKGGGFAAGDSVVFE